MKALADEMACARKPLEDEDLNHYIMQGLDMEYNPIMMVVLARTEATSFSDLFSQLLSFEQRLNLFGGGSQSSVNAANHGHGGRGNPHGRGHGCGGSGGGRGLQQQQPPSVQQQQQQQLPRQCSA